MIRIPTHPGEMLVEEFLSPMQITQRELADAIHAPYQRVKAQQTEASALETIHDFHRYQKMA